MFINSNFFSKLIYFLMFAPMTCLLYIYSWNAFCYDELHWKMNSIYFALYTYSSFFFLNQYFKFTFSFFSVYMATSLKLAMKPIYLKHNVMLSFWSFLIPTKCCIGFIFRYVPQTCLYFVTFCCEHIFFFNNQYFLA